MLCWAVTKLWLHPESVGNNSTKCGISKFKPNTDTNISNQGVCNIWQQMQTYLSGNMERLLLFVYCPGDKTNICLCFVRLSDKYLFVYYQGDKTNICLCIFWVGDKYLFVSGWEDKYLCIGRVRNSVWPLSTYNISFSHWETYNIRLSNWETYIISFSHRETYFMHTSIGNQRYIVVYTWDVLCE